MKDYRPLLGEKLRTLAKLAAKAYKAVADLEQFVTADDNHLGPNAIFKECRHETDWYGLKSKLGTLQGEAEHWKSAIDRHPILALAPADRKRALVLEPQDIILPVWDGMTPRYGGKWGDLLTLACAWLKKPPKTTDSNRLQIYTGRGEERLIKRMSELEFVPRALKQHLHFYFSP